MIPNFENIANRRKGDPVFRVEPLIFLYIHFMRHFEPVRRLVTAQPLAGIAPLRAEIRTPIPYLSPLASPTEHGFLTSVSTGSE